MRKQNDPEKGKIGISWTDYSSNPIRAKTKLESQTQDDGPITYKIKKGWACVHAGTDCDNCYAERLNRRWGTGLEYTQENLKDVEFFIDHKEFKEWNKVSGQRIFPCDMTDLFGGFIPSEMILEVLEEMRDCSQNIFQVLTKRPARLLQFKNFFYSSPNVWWGISAGNQEMLKKRFGTDLETVPNLFLSIEPMIGKISLEDIPGIKAVKWIIAGGESQSGCRPLDTDWLYSLVAQCKDLGIPLFIKQLGGHPDKRKDINQWPETLRVQQFPLAMCTPSLTKEV